GSEFLGYRLIRTLGAGAFGKVYLAEQPELAGRPVALKVACDIADESRSMAQLQHTNIMPVYSIHRAAPFEAICMPYYGATTLATVLAAIKGQGGQSPRSGTWLANVLADGKPERKSTSKTFGRLSFADAILWIAQRLASGLAHAHDRGIVHRDLKPANV